MSSTKETIAFGLGMLALLAIIAHCTGCAATCAAIDLADKTCPLVVEYVDQYGHRRAMEVTNNDARDLAHVKATRDAGAP